MKKHFNVFGLSYTRDNDIVLVTLFDKVIYARVDQVKQFFGIILIG
jgi:hypothetical protein